MKRWRSFPLQLFFLTIVPLAALLLVITFGSLSLHQQAMRTLVGERDERATRAAAAALSEQLNHRAAAIQRLALQAALADNPEHAMAYITLLGPDFDGGLALVATDSEGTPVTTGDAQLWLEPVLTTYATAVPPHSPSEEATFVVLSDDWERDGTMFVVATGGHYVAVGAFSPVALARRTLADVFAPDERATVVIVSATGGLIYGHGATSVEDEEFSQRIGVAEALRGASGTTYRSVAGEEFVIAYSPVPPVGWALVVEEPWRIVADPLLRATELAPLVFLPVLIVALIVLWFGIRQIVQPLQTLAGQATELGWGDFEAINEPVGGIGEIQRLQAELIHMAAKVQRAQQSLRGYLGAVTAGQEEERRRLARELHDDTIQSLIALNQQLQLAQLEGNEPTALARLDKMQQMAEQTIADLRRLTHALRPIYLEDLGLVPALDMLARETSLALGIPITFAATGAELRSRPEVEVALYRIAQESLSNISRHAGATCARVQLDFYRSVATLTIEDDGCGFELPESPAEMAMTGHYGLLSMKERADLIGALLTVASTPGTGTQVVVKTPIAEQSAGE